MQTETMSASITSSKIEGVKLEIYNNSVNNTSYPSSENFHFWEHGFIVNMKKGNIVR